MRILRIIRAAPLLLVAGAAVAGAVQGAAQDRLWEPPLGHPLRIEAAFSLPNGPYRAGHRGIDLSGAPGAEVRAPASGTISFVGMVVDRPVVSIRLDERTVVSMEPVESGLAQGDAIARGEVVGTIGVGGHCGSGCLHLGVRVDGAYVNPLRFLRPRPVLLPW